MDKIKDAVVAAVAHGDLANAIRALSMDAVEQAKSGHPGMPLGMADVATVLFRDFLRFDPADPSWPNRDRFVLSAGHGSMLLYSLLHLTGYPKTDIDQIRRFRQLGSVTAGHPEHNYAPGIETTTGPLGQGLATAVGMALAERMLNARFGSDWIDHRTYVVAGDGCLMEGVSQEAISLAGHLRLGRLIVLWDDNSISIDGSTDLAVSDDQAARFEASGWNVARVDGHDPKAVAAALARAVADPSAPWMIACETVIGYGAPSKAGTHSAHGEPLGEKEIAGVREKLGWPHPPFEVPDRIAQEWRAIGRRSSRESAAWRDALKAAAPEVREAFVHPVGPDRMDAVATVLAEAKAAFAADETKRATRVWSQMTLERLVPILPELVGGSADLTGSNGTKTKSQKVVAAGDFSGGYIHYGVREHGMAAAMNGLALSGSFIPYGGTFLVFSDYARPAIRLSALMRQRVVYVLTHDSIGLGEDGPTHQPVEHLAALRAIPNLQVLRPADAVETVECWEIAIRSSDRPTVLALSRQAVPHVRMKASNENLSAKGGYVVRDAHGARDVTLIATGSEVGLAVAAADSLAKDGVRAAVVSLPSFELFRAQPQEYRDKVLGDARRLGIEAAVELGWREWLRPADAFLGMTGFGVSAPGGDAMRHFGFTPENVAQRVREFIS